MVKVNKNQSSQQLIKMADYQPSNDKINNRNTNGGNGNMHDDKYVTKDVFNANMQRIDDNFDMLSHQIDDLRDDIKTTIPLQVKNSILEEREYQRNQQRETRHFLWGTIGVGILSIIVTIVIAVFQFLH